jgi:hypothetical protein
MGYRGVGGVGVIGGVGIIAGVDIIRGMRDLYEERV